MTTSREHDSSPTPSKALRYFLVWLRGFHRDRERSKAAEWAMVVLTALGLIAAGISAVFVYLQLRDAQNNFKVDERAWVELEPLEGTLDSPRTPNMNDADFSYPIHIRNVGKTVARDVEVRGIDDVSQNLTTMGSDANWVAWVQDQLLLGKVSNTKGILITDISVPTVLVPNSSTATPATLFGAEPQASMTHQYVSYLVGRVDYADEFGVRHWLKFCFFVADDKGRLRNCKQGNDVDHNSELAENVGTNRGGNHTLLWSIFGTLMAGVLTSLMASFFYAKFASRIRDQRLRDQFSKLAGEYQETERNAHGFPIGTGGRVTLTYCGGTKFKTKGLMQNGELLWEGELFMSEEAGVLGRGFYSHTTRDDTGIHQVVHNPVSGHFNVSGENTSHANGRKFKMAWMPLR